MPQTMNVGGQTFMNGFVIERKEKDLYLVFVISPAYGDILQEIGAFGNVTDAENCILDILGEPHYV